MNRAIVYQWRDEIRQHLPVSAWVGLGLALFSSGVIEAERCTLSKVAERLVGVWGKVESIERRLERVLENEHLAVREWGVAWIRWVVSRLDSRAVVLLVDETKLGEHLSVMMVGLAYAQRSIPLAWRCYRAYPKEGQVKLIAKLLRRVKAGLPADCCPVVQADRGIGTSPGLVRVVKGLGWRFLFRVQNTTKLTSTRGQTFTLGLQASGWSANGLVFKQRGRVRAYAFVYREYPYAEHWCLITNDPMLCPRHYALRSWCEQGFRDLKSGGWAWQRSQVWQPDHAERLILVLALAYARMLTLGTLAASLPSTRPRPHPLRSTLSCFRIGLRFWRACLAQARAIYPGLFFAPLQLLL
jgi:Transposase DDE domain